MKKFNFKTLLLAIGLVVASTQPAWAEKGFFGSGQWNFKYYDGKDHWGSEYGDKSECNLGTQTTLWLNESWVKTWSNGGWTQSEVIWYYWFNSSDTKNVKTTKSSVQGDQTWNFSISGGFNMIANAPNNPGVNTLYMNWKLDNYVSSGTSTIKFTIPGFTTTSTSKSYTAVVNNNSSQTISFGTHYGTTLSTSNCSITGTNSSDFTVTDISESGVTVKFAPSTVGTKSATLTITDAHSKTCTISLTGTAKPTAVTGFTQSVTDKLSGNGSNSEPYIIKYNTNVTVSLTADKWSDGNAALQFKVGPSGSWTTATSGTTGTATIKTTNISTTDNVTIYYRYYNSANSIAGAESSTTIYYKSASYSVTLNANGGTIADGKDITSYNYGVGATLPTAPDEVSRAGYDFDGWFLNNTGDAVTAIGTDESGIKSFTAHWTQNIQYYKLTLSIGADGSLTSVKDNEGNTIDVNKVVGGTTVIVTVTPNLGYEVDTWTCGGASQIGENTYITTISANTEIDVTFKETKYTVNVAKGTGVSSVSPASVQVGQINASGDITATPATGYELNGWTLGTGITIVEGTNSPIKIKATQAGTITAKAKAKTYTISFDQNGGEGGQTETVTATYAAAMPTPITLPTRVGYKFKGYYDATSGGKKYYNANGTSANNWDKDANTTLYAQWTQMHVYVQGRMHVANKKRSAGGDITWTNSFNGGSSTETSAQWAEACRAIEMQLVTENDRTYYKLVTNATLSDLSTKFSGGDNLWQYFYLRSTSVTTSNGAWDGYIYRQVENGNSFKLADRGEAKARAWSAEGTNQPCFSDDDRSGYVVIYFDETKVWYDLEEFNTRNITVNHGLGGNVEPSSTIKVGEVSWEVKATAGTGYYFSRWTASDANIHFEDATQPTTKITATGTGDGSITANFVATTMIYFQKPSSWTGNDVYVYFYNSDDGYWKTEKSTGGTEKGAGASGQKDGKKMEYINDNTYRIDYHPDEAHKALAFVNAQQNGYEAFDNTSVSYRKDFNKCSVNNWFIPENKVTGYYNKHDDNQTAYYNDGYWTSYTYLPVGYFLKNSRGNWEPLDEYHFQDTEDASVKRLVVNNVNENDEIEFKIWQTCDCWLGVGATGCVIKEDTKNYGINTGNENITLEAWKTGSYEFVLYTKTNSLDVTYLGDITVANFPGEVSTFVYRQHKIKPDVTLRNGTSVTDVKILVEGHELPWSSSYATYEQNGTNLVITGNAIGTEDVTVRYQNNKQDPYIVERTLKVNVATPIIIQAKLKKDEDGLTDDYWSKTGLVHIHFWGTDATKTQDMDMSYNKDTKVFSVTAPKIDGFSFMFWYGEDINQSASEQWRKTNDITDCTTNTCYSISYETDKNTKRTATPKSGLCTTDEYYVEITMKNGNTYKSNTIDDLNDIVSFFAPKDDDATYMGGTVRIVHNGEVSSALTGFDAAGVYVAKIASATAFAENSIKPYTGKYYIRTDGADGGWNDYKENADNEFVEFTRRENKNETYSYYWVKNVAKTEKTNVKGDVANDYNDNLAGMIENDKFTDGGGFIYQSTNGANVRFSYEPTTNEFKRAIIGGSSDNNFLNIYSKDAGRLYADKEGTKELNENADLLLSKFNDVSDWVYEKVVYAQADGSHPTSVVLKSVYNGQTSHLLGYNKNAKGEDTDDPKPLEVLGEHTNTGTYALRISYDYKRNRLMASWEPGNLSISENQIIDADVLFIQKEKGTTGLIDDENVAQITYTDAGIIANAKLTSLKNIMYILEITPNVITDTQADNQLYWFSLPFDCKINDIFGVEDYVTLDANGQATAGTWGIQRYDGATRASHGWFQDDNPEGFWRWMKRNETLVAGTGYVLVFDKTNASSWKSIGVEEPCEETDPECEDGKKTVPQQIKRLYFPSIGTSFEISYSGGSSSVPYTDNPCNVEKRREYDGNWKVIGPMSYNNIGVDTEAGDNLTFYYTYDQSAAQGHRYSEKQTITGSEEFKSFHSYMTQFGGTLTWKPFTKSSEVVKAPHYTENPEFQGGMLTIELRNAKGEELNHTFINLSKNGTTGFDQNLDLTKITENCAQIASVSEDVLYAGNTLPLDIETVPLNVKVVANGTYDIALAESLDGLEVRLYDAFEQTTTPLDLMSATVTLDKGEYKDRFFLQFVQKSPLTPTSFDGVLEQLNLPSDKTQKLLINDQIFLINAGRIYNASGTKVR